MNILKYKLLFRLSIRPYTKSLLMATTIILRIGKIVSSSTCIKIRILICPLQFFRFTFSKTYSIHILMRVELETILPIRSIVVATGKLFVYGLMETLNNNLYLKIFIYIYIYI